MKHAHITILKILDNENDWMLGLEIVEVSGDKLRREKVFKYLNELEKNSLIDSRAETNLEDEPKGWIPERQYHISSKGKTAYQAVSASESKGRQPAQV